MPWRSLEHEELMAGLAIYSKYPDSEVIQSGTLTGIATLHPGGERVAVTAAHVVAKSGSFDVTKEAEVHQGTPRRSNQRIGNPVRWTPADLGPVPVSLHEAEAAAITLSDSVTPSLVPHRHLGGNPDDHTPGRILAGVREPTSRMRLLRLGAVTGPSNVVVVATHFVTAPGLQIFYNVFITRPVDGSPESEPGDSGAPLLLESSPGEFHMVGLHVTEHPLLPTGAAVKASIIEQELDITFGDPTVGVGNEGIPILTSEGFAGRKLIIDDHFKAGEDLMAGDVVGINPVSESDDDPALFKMDSDMEPHMLIGIVHTPAGKQVGDRVASSPDLVPVVVHGIAKARASDDIGVGDSVTPEMPTEPLAADAPSRVKTARSANDPIIGRCVSARGADEEKENRVIDVLVDISGAGHAPSQS